MDTLALILMLPGSPTRHTAAAQAAPWAPEEDPDWVQRTPANAPAVRYYHAMAYDAKRGVSVLFAGYNGEYLADTWEWDGVDWVQRFPDTSPVARYDHAMAFDGRRGATVLFGGLLDGIYYLGDTWEYPESWWVIYLPLAVRAYQPAGR